MANKKTKKITKEEKTWNQIQKQAVFSDVLNSLCTLLNLVKSDEDISENEKPFLNWLITKFMEKFFSGDSWYGIKSDLIEQYMLINGVLKQYDIKTYEVEVEVEEENEDED